MSQKITIPAAAIQSLLFVSKDEFRSNINNLLIEADTEPGHWVAVATDGHRLTAVRWVDKDAHLDGPVLIRRASLVAVAKVSKKEPVRFDIASKTEAIARIGGASVLVALDDSSTFPDWRMVSADGEGTAEDVTINPQYVIDVCTHAKKYVVLKDKGITARVSAWVSPLGPTHWRACNVETDVTADYVVMPMRM